MSGSRPTRVTPAARKRVGTRTHKKEERQAYFDAREGGLGKLAAASLAGITPKTAKKWEDAWLEAGNPAFDDVKAVGPKKLRNVNHAARHALKDFNLFQERYLGRVSLPWQKTAAEEIARLEKSPEREFVVANMPPGAGKSTLFTHDIPCWLIANNRGIRICILSSTQNNAEKFVDRIRRTLEATVPIQAPEKELRNGTAKDAITTLTKDFGRFKPEEATTWTKKKFFVDRPKEDESHKDATVEGFGRDQAVLGGRFDVVICDDVYDPKNAKTFEAKEEIKAWFSDVAESRVEPGGLMLLVMQRVDPEDLSRHCLDMEAWDDSEEEIDDDEVADLRAEAERLGVEELPIRDGKRRKYRHLIYKSHFDEQCQGAAFHKLSSPAYPQGCLLYPRRLSYRDLKTREKSDPGKFRVWYQQEDFAPGNVLCEPVWLSGGIDEFGVERPGCRDKNRGIQEMPPGLSPGFFSLLTVDPSPANFWAVEWWIYDPADQTLYLIDLVRQKMASPVFFNYEPRTNEYDGVLINMADAAMQMGAPITHLIFEKNVAQRWMMEATTMHEWLRSRRIASMPHETTASNKNNTELGVQGLQTWFREGRMRLPYKQDGRSGVASMKLEDEATRYRLDGTSAYYTDCVMAAWIATKAVNNLYRPKKQLPLQSRPSWMRQPNLGVVSA